MREGWSVNLNSYISRNTILTGCHLAPARRMDSSKSSNSKFASRSYILLCYAILALFLATPCLAQDWIKTGTGLGVEKIRIAVPDFKAATPDPKNADLVKAFNDTLWNDLDNAGIFEMVSKSFYPLGAVGNPPDVKFEQWSAPPPNASMLAFGNLGAAGGNV